MIPNCDCSVVGCSRAFKSRKLAGGDLHAAGAVRAQNEAHW